MARREGGRVGVVPLNLARPAASEVRLVVLAVRVCVCVAMAAVAVMFAAFADFLRRGGVLLGCIWIAPFSANATAARAATIAAGELRCEACKQGVEAIREAC
eukprot:8294894-Pyramimonas_sp.AAC.1